MNKVYSFINKYKFNNIAIPLCVFIVVYVFETMSNHYALISVPYDFIEEVFGPIEFISLGIMIIPDLLSLPLITKEKIIFIVTYVFAYYNFHLTYNTSLYFIVMLCFAIRHEKFEDVLDFISKVMILYILMMIGYWFINAFILKGSASLPDFDADRFRFTFDMGHPNAVGQYLTSIIGIRLYLEYKKENNRVFYLAIAISLFTRFFVNSRTAFIIQILMIIIFVLLKKYEILKKPLKVFSYISFPLCAALLNILTFLYSKGTKVGLFFNELLSGRLYLNNLAFSRLNIEYLGSNFSFNDFLDGGYMDSFYPYLALKYGFIWIILISIGFAIVTKKGNVKDHIMIIMFSLYAMSEHTIMNFAYLFILLVLHKVFVEDKKEII